MTQNNDRVPGQRQADDRQGKRRSVNRRPTVHPCEALTLIEFRMLAVALIEGIASDDDLRILDARTGTKCLALWANEQILMADENENDPQISALVQNEPLKADEMEAILRGGFCDFVSKSQSKRHAMRSIAALLFDIDRLLEFAKSLKERGFPSWCRENPTSSKQALVNSVRANTGKRR